MKKTFLTIVLLVFASQNSQASITITDKNHPIAQDFNLTSELNPQVRRNIKSLAKFKSEILQTQVTANIISKSKASSTVEIIWYSNKNKLYKIISDRMQTYEGEDKNITSSTRGYKTGAINNLYFKEKPLGQLNGFTQKFHEGFEEAEIIKKLFSNTKAFIIVTNNNTTHSIPIASGASKPDCGSGLFDNNIEIFCVQTASPVGSELSIGNKLNYTNILQFPNEIRSQSDLTISIAIYYKGYKI